MGMVEEIKLELKNIISMVLGIELKEIEDDKVLFSMGFDSLMLFTLGKQISSRYDLSIPLGEFFSNINTLDKISRYINDNYVKKEEDVVLVNSENEEYREEIIDGGTRIVDLKELQKVFNNQLQVISDQNNIIKNIYKKSKANVLEEKSIIKEKEISKGSDKNRLRNKIDNSSQKYFVPYHKFEYEKKDSLNELEIKYIKNIESKYINLTKKSKEKAQRYRDVYANARNSSGFNLLFKEMIYQVIAEKAKGSKIIDIDGNEIIDITMGFGVNLFGYAPEFVKSALLEEIENGMPLGAMGRLPGKVAKQISELTGLERVFFCNSGTEANMFALRVARAITGKNKVVCFTGSYHGTYDGVLGLPSLSEDSEIISIPIAPGITKNAVADLVLLPYNSPQSLKYIEEHSHDIAAVLVETVQSRRPDIQPKEFLLKLRKVTEDSNIALIFDEIITGFRISAGGAQEYFGIEADIATYGKVIGGGMPIGVVAGSSKFLDSIDGGTWSFGDSSVPECNERKTYAAGTFCHHPMAMASANAVLTYINKNKDKMYEDLNNRTNNFIKTINEFFIKEDVSFLAVNFGSLFRFNIAKEYEIFYYGLLEKGVYIWEGRNCFLSTEHTDEDINKIICAIKSVVLEMKEVGFFAGDTEDNLNEVVGGIDEGNNKSLEENEFQMSLIQKRLFSHILLNESDPFDIIGALKVNGYIDVNRIEDIVNKIISRHEMLRTSMYMKEGEFYQKVHPNCKIKVKIKQFNDDISVDDIITKSLTPFNLKNPPLIETIIAETNENEKLIIFHFHHTAADGISMNVFVKEFIALYNGDELKDLDKQYKDYVEWEHNSLSDEKLEEYKKYWLESIEGTSCKVFLPYDNIANNSSNYNGKTLVDLIDRDTAKRLKEVAKKYDSSLFMVLFAVFSLMIHKTSGEDGVSIATPVSNRFEGRFEESIGMFTNTVALSSKYDSGFSFKDYLLKIRDNCIKSYSCLNYPYNMLINELKIAGDSLFNIMFVYENTDDRSLNLNDLDVERINYFSEIKEFEISVELLEKDDEIGIFWAYRSDLFNEDTMMRMINYLKNIIAEITNNTLISIDNINVISKNEEDEIIKKFNPGSTAYPKEKTVVSLFEEQVLKTPYNIAIEFKKQKVTYDELNRKSNILAHKLRKLGVKPDDFVAIVADRSIEMIIGIYGILKAGGAYIPIDVSNPIERINYIIEDSKAKVLLTYNTDVESNVTRVDISEIDLWEEKTGNLDLINRPSDIAYSIYTSGTTGKPKGVVIEHRNVVRLFVNDDFKFNFNSDDIWIMFHSYCFDFSVWEMYGATLFGGKLIIMSEEEVKDSYEVMRIIKGKRVTVLNQVPSAFYNLLDADSEENELSLRYLIFGGEALDPRRLSKWYEWHPEVRIINMYGITETTVHVTYREIGKREIEKGINDIGKAIPTLAVYIMNGNSLCGVGVPGELCISGDGVARGYLNRPELTSEKFVDNRFGEGKLYRSGDLARWLPDGNIEYMGRIDEQVKIRGFRIELGEIANVIRDIDYINDVLVISREDSLGDNTLCAYVVSNQEINNQEIKKIMRIHLPEYMIPSYIMRIGKVPITKNGKLNKKELPIIEFENRKQFIAPRTETEKLILDIFSKVLGIGQIGVKDNFFEIGGHSLRAARIMNRIEEELGIKLPIRSIFKYQTIESLSSFIEDKSRSERNRIPKAKIKEMYEMSSPQKRMYMIWEMNKKDTVYNMNKCYRVEGKLDLKRLEKSLSTVISRHEILRTNFISLDGELYQKINDKIEGSISYLDDSVNREKEIIEEFIKPFNLNDGPLIRVQVIRQTMDSYLLMFDLHHIIGDGMSIGILIQELKDIYNGNEVKKIDTQHKDYSEWSRNKDRDIQKSYWVDQFKDGVEVLDIPLDFIRPQIQSYKGDTVKLSISKALRDKVKRLAEKINGSEYMVLLSVIMILMSKYSNQDEVIIGTPVSGRTHKDTEEMLGMFVNTLGLKGMPTGDKKVSGFLEEIRECCFNGFENQEYPFEELIEEVNIVRDMSRNPIFDVMFAYQNNDEVELNLNHLKLKEIEENTIISKFDLTFNIRDVDNRYVVELEYCSDLFKKESVTRMINHFLEILNQVVDNDEKLLSQVEVITEYEKEEIINKFNNTYSEYPRDKTVIELFEEQVAKKPDKIAIICDEEKLSYKQLNQRANIIAEELMNLGVKKNEFVTVMADKNISSIIGIYGILKAGAAYVPIDPKYPVDRVDYIINDCKSNILLVSESNYDGNIEAINIKTILKERKISNNIMQKNSPNDIAYAIYTSGTTGRSKGSIIKNSSIVNLVINPNYVKLDDSIVLLQTGAIAFDASTFEIHGALLNGGCVCLASANVLMDAESLKEYIKRLKVNTVFITTALFNQLLESDNSVFDNLTNLLFGGEQTIEKYTNILRERKTVPYFANVYGPTEATTFASYYPIEKKDNKTPIGKPISNTKMYVINNMCLCGIGVKGELCIAGDGVSIGYLNNCELTKEKFIKNPYGEGILYRTGDMVRWLADGNIEYLGRIDEQVKVHGFRIEINEIEKAFRSNDYIKDVAVTIKNDKYSNKSICAYYVSDMKLDISKIKDYLREYLPEYMIPSYIMEVESIPVTINGKVNKKKLPEIKLITEREYIAPSNEEEVALCEIFKDVLCLEEVGIRESFLEFGGDSIKAIRVVSKMREKGYEISFKEIMVKQTVERISKVVRELGINLYEQDEIIGEVPLTPIIRDFNLWNLNSPNHFNQDVMLKIATGDIKLIKKTVNLLVKHHDILRAIYHDGKLRILDFNSSLKYDFKEFDFTGDKEDKLKIARECTLIQKNMDISKGPLVKVALFSTDNGYYCMLCIHHLVIDGVSWRILIEDFNNIINNLINGSKVELPLKTASFIEWATQLEDYKQSKECQSEILYWNDVNKNISNFSIKNEVNNDIKGYESITVSFSKDETEKLLHECNRAYNTNVSDLLISALILTVNETTGQDSISVGLEGHGREIVGKEIDIDRTIGWFTSMYPVNFRCFNDIESCIINSKESLREVPNNGIGYGLLKERLSEKYWDICFNYLGQMDEGSNLNSSGEEYSTGKSSDEKNIIPGDINLNGIILGGNLEFTILFNLSVYQKKIVENFLCAYKENLKGIIDFCILKGEVVRTKSDIATSPIKNSEFDEIINLFNFD